MMRTALVGVVVAILIATLVVPPAAGQETVEILLKLARGEVLHATYTATGNISLQILDIRSTSTILVEAREVTRVLDVGDDGTMLVEVVWEDYRIREGTRTQEPLDPPLTLRVRPDGRIVEKPLGEFEGDDYPMGLPGRPVRVGESWNRQTRIAEDGATGEATQTFTLAAVESTPEGRVARITSRLDGRVSSTSSRENVQSRTTGTVRGSSEIVWSVDRGRPLRVTEDITFAITSEATGASGTVRISSSMRTVSRREPLPADRVAVPAVAPEFLIALGKGIGGVTLDQPVDDISGRLGSSTPRTAEMGLRAPSVSWPGNVVGYLDPQDQTKLLGLETSDRRFRTDKGIGFGSSQGAMLMAYGMSPVRVDLTIPSLGGVRMLVYDEQGIAFAITSDKAHAGAGPNHAPLGAVDWVTIFPAGGAAKIFPLP